MKYIIPIILITLTSLSSASPPDGYEFKSYSDVVTPLASRENPVFIYYGRTGCGYCDKMNTLVFSDADVKDALTSNYSLVYINSEGSKKIVLPNGKMITESQWGELFNLVGTPSFHFIDKNGKFGGRYQGYMDKDSFLKLILNYKNKTGG